MSYNAKQAHLIIHQHIQYALEVSQVDTDLKCVVQLAPIIQRNRRQLWLLQGQIGGTFEIVNAHTDQMLTNEEEKLILKMRSSSQNQTWVLQFVSDHQFVIKQSKQKAKYLCLRNGSLVFCQFNPPSQPDIWVLKTILDNPKLNSSCFIISTDSKQLIDVSEGSRDQGSTIQLKQPSFHFTQRWNIYKAGQIYVIKSLFAQFNLDIGQGRFYDQNDIVLRPSEGNVNQFWFFQKLYSSIFRISTFFDPQLQLGHSYGKLILHKGRKFSWMIQGHLPQ